MNNFFGSNLRILRKNRNMSQEDLAELLQYDFRNISKWESDLQGIIPSYDVLVTLTKIFDIDMHTLVEVDLQKYKDFKKFSTTLLTNEKLLLEFQKAMIKFLYVESNYENVRKVSLSDFVVRFDNYEFPKLLISTMKKERFNMDKLYYVINKILTIIKDNGIIAYYDIKIENNELFIKYKLGI